MTINEKVKIYNKDHFERDGVSYVCKVGDPNSSLDSFLDSGQISKLYPLKGGGTSLKGIVYFRKGEHARQMFEQLRMGTVTFGQVLDCNAHRRD